MSIQNLVTELCSSIETALQQILPNYPDIRYQNEMNMILEFCCQTFLEISSERFLKILLENKLYENPHGHNIANEVSTTILNMNPTLNEKPISAY